MKKNIAALILSSSALLALSLAGAARAQSAGDAAAGKSLWDGNFTQCRNCHGKDGEGAFGPDLAGRGLSPSEFKQAVRKPWGIMPAYVESQYSDQDLSNLAAYFATLPKKADPGPWRFTADASMPHGQQVFHDVGCAQCHGPTFDMPRGTLGGLNADFNLFKQMVFTHTDVMEKVEEELAQGNPLPPLQPPGGGAGRRPPLRMGNFVPTRVTEAELKDIYDWAHGDIGFRPQLQARMSAPASGANGASYTLAVANNGLKGKGITAQGMTIDVAVPAGVSVVSATGDGYKGTHMDGAATVAEWNVASLAPKEAKNFTLVLSKPVGGGPEGLKGTIRWAKPGPKSGPNKDVQNFAPPGGGPGGAAGGGG